MTKPIILSGRLWRLNPLRKFFDAFAAYQSRRKKHAEKEALAAIDPAVLADIGIAAPEKQKNPGPLLDLHPAAVLGSLSLNIHNQNGSHETTSS
jgi:hypothetical protein